jgi:hypothetical protein
MRIKRGQAAIRERARMRGIREGERRDSNPRPP